MGTSESANIGLKALWALEGEAEELDRDCVLLKTSTWEGRQDNSQLQNKARLVGGKKKKEEENSVVQCGEIR